MSLAEQVAEARRFAKKYGLNVRDAGAGAEVEDALDDLEGVDANASGREN